MRSGWALSGHGLEVNRQALQFVEVEEIDDFLETRGALGGIGKPPGEPLPVPFSLDGILQQRKDRLRGIGHPDSRQPPMIKIVANADVASLHAEPSRNDPIEMRQILLQRREGALVPIGVEADAQRASRNGAEVA